MRDLNEKTLNETGRVCYIYFLCKCTGYGGLAHVNRPATESSVQSEIRMDSRSADTMSPQHLGCDAFPSTLVGRSTDRSR